MKKFKTLLTAICFSLLFTTNTKAQDETNCGLYIDGVIAESIPSWGFGEMKAVIPKTAEWDKFDLVVGYVYITGYKTRVLKIGSFDFLQEDLNDFSDADYIAYNIFTKKDDPEEQRSRMQISANYYCSNCKWESYDEGLISPEKRNKQADFQIKVIGYKQTGTVINNNGVKEPVYGDMKYGRSWYLVNEHGGTLLYESKKVPYTICYCSYDKASAKAAYKNKEKYQENRDDLLECESCKIDYSKPPVIPGKKFPFTIEKVDYAGKYGKVKKGASSGSNTKTEVKTNNTTTTTKTTVTKTTTTKTTSGSTSSSALTAASLKPLDKSKPGYFVEKDGGVITQEGYKKGDARNGEVRVYDEGKLRSVTTYVNDEKNGPAALYYSNGNLEERGNYKGDNKEGEWKRYTEAGKLAGTDVYVDGEKQ